MRKALVSILIMVAAVFSDVQITGNVVDKDLNAIPNARITLAGDSTRVVFSDKNGQFSFDYILSPAKHKPDVNDKFSIKCKNSNLFLNLQSSQKAGLKLLDLNGRSVWKNSQVFSEGSHRIDFGAAGLSSGVYLLMVKIGRIDNTFKIQVIQNQLTNIKSPIVFTPQTRTNTKADLESSFLKVEKFGFSSQTLAVQSYPSTFENITLYPDSISLKVDSILDLMTLEEKVGQMTQAERGKITNSQIRSLFIGSILSGGGSGPTVNSAENWATMVDGFAQAALQTRLGIPLIYGIDAVHGNNNLYGAVIFPHNIGLGCTRNPELVKQAARITAIETGASGPHWTFAPCVTVPRNERWGRTYEGFGETPELAAMMGEAAIKGLQGDNLGSDSTIAACAKHFVGDGGTENGIDRGDTRLSEEQLRAIHLQGYISAVREDVATIMASYSSWNGESMHGHKYLLTDVLKKELGFNGFIVSDWDGIDTLSTSYRTAVKNAINAGIDMVMTPSQYEIFITDLKSLVNSGEVPVSRIDDAVKRILSVKYRMGLFEHPLAKRAYLDRIGSQEHRQIARECVRQSVVLLKNEQNTLPVPKQGKRIVVGGTHANDLGRQCGGWSITWQGSIGNITTGTTILQAVKNSVADPSSVISSSTFDPTADFAIIALGENPYAEYNGDRTTLELSSTSVALINQYHQAGIPVVVILISGRPMLVNDILPNSSAFIAAWLPGTEGQGIADVLFGDYAPTGKLSHSWPRDMNQIPINAGDSVYDPLFEYGFGLTY